MIDAHTFARLLEAAEQRRVGFYFRRARRTGGPGRPRMLAPGKPRLGVLLAQVATGLIGDDEIAFTGPLNRFVETGRGLAATSYHKGIGQWLLIALAALHIGAVMYYLLKKRSNLILPMIHGDKLLSRDIPPSRDDTGSRLIALVLFALCSAFVAWIVSLGG